MCSFCAAIESRSQHHVLHYYAPAPDAAKLARRQAERAGIPISSVECEFCYNIMVSVGSGWPSAELLAGE